MDDIIKIACRNLRKNMTKSEVILWDNLKTWKIWKKFYRQKPIFVFKENSWLDRYIIADFYSPENKLVIEIDWSIHEIEEIYNLDKEKEELLKNRWFKVIRFENEEVFEGIESVIERIMRTF